MLFPMWSVLLSSESCGGHFREEYQTKEGEAVRNDDTMTNVAAWEFQSADKESRMHIEDLEFENVRLTTRSYK